MSQMPERASSRGIENGMFQEMVSRRLRAQGRAVKQYIGVAFIGTWFSCSFFSIVNPESAKSLAILCVALAMFYRALSQEER
jgi:hypothetical protein